MTAPFFFRSFLSLSVASVAAATFGCTSLSGAADLAIAGSCDGPTCTSADSITSARPDKAKAPTEAPAAAEGESPPAGGGGVLNPDGTPPAGTPPGGVVDPNPKPVDHPVECGDRTCGGATPICCVGNQGSTKTCVADGAGCLGAVVHCGARDACGGSLCCLSLSARATACVADDACSGDGQLAFCRTNSDCPAGKVCVPTTGSFEDHKGCI